MKLATQRLPDGTTRAVVLEGDVLHALPASDVGALLRNPGWRSLADSDGEWEAALDIDFAAPILRPGKVICVGLNYREHILEMGRELPEYPTLFAKYGEAIIGPREEIVLPPESAAMDWEGELAVVIGTAVRRVAVAEAESAIAGYTILNDVTARDFQYRTQQWLQGKTFEATTPIGPVLVTPDELPADAEISTFVDDDEVQQASLSDLVFGPRELVSYISTILTLQPGDIIATGTPAGVGHAMRPPRYLTDGTRLRTRVSAIGEMDNHCRVDR